MCLYPSERQAQAEKWKTDHATEDLQWGPKLLCQLSLWVNPGRLVAWEAIVSKSKVFRCLSLVHAAACTLQIMRIYLSAHYHFKQVHCWKSRAS